MAASLPDHLKAALDAPTLAHVATLNPDGSPQCSAVWVDRDGDIVRFNTAEGRVKPRNLRHDPRVAVSLTAPDNAYQHLQIQGRVRSLTSEGADDHIDSLAKQYLDEDTYPFRAPGEVRLIVEIEPERVSG